MLSRFPEIEKARARSMGRASPLFLFHKVAWRNSSLFELPPISLEDPIKRSTELAQQFLFLENPYN